MYIGRQELRINLFSLDNPLGSLGLGTYIAWPKCHNKMSHLIKNLLVNLTKDFFVGPT